MSLVERDKKVVWHPFTQVKIEDDPLPIVRAKGALMFDENDKSYIDCNSSWWVNVHGHGREEILEAISTQFKTLDHVLLAGVTHPKAVELSEKILKILPSNFSKVFFSDNGSTAVEVALKMVLQYWYNKGVQKNKILAMEGAYHGDTFGAMSVGQRGYFNQPFEQFFFEADFLPFPTEQNHQKCLKRAEDLFKSGDFAGLIVEPLVQGSAGMRMYSIDFLNDLMHLAKKYDVLTIFDEVMTGWARTGKLFAMDHCDDQPDIVCLSKGLTAGVLPLGLTVATEKIFQAFYNDDKLKALLHGHSFTGNALACAAACANIDLFEKEETKLNIKRVAAQHLAFSKEISDHTLVKNLRVLGTIIAFEVDINEETSYFSSIRDEAYRYFKNNGMMLRPLGNVLFLNPPYVISNEELSYCYEKITAFLDMVKNSR